MKQNKVQKLISCIWFLVPVLSLVRLSQPMLEIRMGMGISTVAALPTRTYNGFQLLLHASLVNTYNDIVADIRNPGLILLKIMIMLQLIFDVIVVFLCLWEWRKKQTGKMLLWLRGILSIGYVMTAFVIYRFISVCSDYLRINHYPLHSSISRTSYIFPDEYELEVNILFSTGVLALFIVTWWFFRRKKMEI
jgi:hypothetical protein